MELLYSALIVDWIRINLFDIWIEMGMFLYILYIGIMFGSMQGHVMAQSEGDIGYDYEDVYDDVFDVDEGIGDDPQFDVPLVNVTVVAGQTAMLPCSITHIGKKYKVSWTDRDTTLTYEDRRIVDDPRFIIVRTFVNSWNLQIRDVKWTDQGPYHCTINTQPIRFKTVLLHVKVPPRIIDGLSSNDETVTEGDTVILVCNVTGDPKPMVTWYRQPVHSGESKESKMCEGHERGPGIGRTGEMIIISNVSRYCDDIYECQATNGVLPDVSRTIRVTVQFAPEVTIRTPIISQSKGKDTILECKITGNPQAVNVWRRDGQRITGSVKHLIEAYDDEESNTISLNLQILDITEDDYGVYTCSAANALGEDQGTVTLKEITFERSTIPTIIFHLSKPATSTRMTYVFPSKPDDDNEWRYESSNEVDLQPALVIGSGGSASQCTQQRHMTIILTMFLTCLHYVYTNH